MPETELTTLQREAALDPLKIEKVLGRLWREYADSARQGGTLGARARLANLISYCRSNAEADAAADAVAALNGTRPVRSLLVVAEPGKDGTSEAGAAIKCGQAGGRPVCYEEVVLHTPGESARALPSLLEPLTIPDLPTYLWFPGDPALASAEVDRLFPIVDRVVTDSHSFADPLDRFQRLNDLVRQNRGECVFSEMTWTRLGTWREAIGKLFDPEPSREFLPRISEVEITSVHGAGEPSDRALLTMGWLASRLCWRPVRIEPGPPWTAHYEAAGGSVTVTMKEGPATARGHLLGLEMRAGEVQFTVRRLHNDPSGAIRSLTICSGEDLQGPAYHPLHWQISELLCNALEIRSPFPDWEDALAAIAGLAR